MTPEEPISIFSGADVGIWWKRSHWLGVTQLGAGQCEADGTRADGSLGSLCQRSCRDAQNSSLTLILALDFLGAKYQTM